MRSVSMILIMVGACGGGGHSARRAPPEDWQTHVNREHQEKIAKLQQRCDAGIDAACGSLGIEYVVAHEYKEAGTVYTDTTFKLDPDKGLPMVEKACNAVLAGPKDAIEDSAYVCRVLLEHGHLDDKQAESMADTLCTASSAYCDLAETADRKAGNEDKAKAAHNVYTSWYCLYWSDHTSEYSAQDKLDKVQAACDETKARGDADDAGCHKDTDCKGDRVCDDGTCKAPAKK